MLTLKHIGLAIGIAVIAAAVTVDTADARRGGGGGGFRGGGFGGGAGMRGGGFGGGRAHVSRPIARPGVGTRPGGPGWANRPGWGNGGWGYRPGYGWGAAAVGAGIASSYYNDGYYGDESPGADADAVAYCAQRFRSYDPASRTYLANSGRRVSCP
jgi:hypothetical protein